MVVESLPGGKVASRYPGKSPETVLGGGHPCQGRLASQAINRTSPPEVRRTPVMTKRAPT